jgi:hypothetical protein
VIVVKVDQSKIEEDTRKKLEMLCVMVVEGGEVHIQVKK